MTMNFQNKVALVTGGVGGIGEAITRIFLENGAKVSLCDINIVEGKKLSQKLQKEFGTKRVIFSKCDVTKDNEFEAAYNDCEKQFGTVDILCNNAGFTSKDVNQTMAVNFGGVVRGTELALKRMGKHNGGKGGYVVNIASIAGLVRFPAVPYYSSSKAAAIQYSRDIGHEFHYDYSGVSILCLCPSVVDAPFGTVDVLIKGSFNSYTDEVLKTALKNASAKLSTKEVAEGVVQLIKENKTGSVLVVESGVKPYYVTPSVLKEF